MTTIPSDAHLKSLDTLLAAACTPDLLLPAYRAHWTHDNPLYGFCSAASEALWFILGGAETGWQARVAREDDGTTHWWLKHESGRVADPTQSQYRLVGKVPPYERGKPGIAGGFMGIRRDPENVWGTGRRPSSRASIILSRVLAAEGVDLESPGAVIAWAAQWRPPARHSLRMR